MPQDEDLQLEKLTQVDEHNKVIGPIPRGVAHSAGSIYYRTIYVVVKNAAGNVLLQKRSKSKDLYPDCWDLSVGGHVMYGERYEETVVREMKEELGITVAEKDVEFKGEVLVRLPKSNEYFHVYEYTTKPSDRIRASVREVSETRWMSIREIKNSIANKTISWYPRPEQVVRALY